MTKGELIQELRKLTELQKTELSDMKRYRDRYDDIEGDCTECWRNGFDDAQEYLENAIAELDILMRSVDIDSTLENTIPTSDKQIQLL